MFRLDGTGVRTGGDLTIIVTGSTWGMLVPDGPLTVNEVGWDPGWKPRAGTGTGQQPGTWNATGARSPQATRWTPVTGACDT